MLLLLMLTDTFFPPRNREKEGKEGGFHAGFWDECDLSEDYQRQGG